MPEGIQQRECVGIFYTHTPTNTLTSAISLFFMTLHIQARMVLIEPQGKHGSAWYPANLEAKS